MAEGASRMPYIVILLPYNSNIVPYCSMGSVVAGEGARLQMLLL